MSDDDTLSWTEIDVPKPEPSNVKVVCITDQDLYSSSFESYRDMLTKFIFWSMPEIEETPGRADPMITNFFIWLEGQEGELSEYLEYEPSSDVEYVLSSVV